MEQEKTVSSYKQAGVDIEAGNELARRIARMVKVTQRPEVVSGVGGFAGISALPPGLADPLLVSSTDGVGTKLRLAFLTGKHDTVGIDLVAMGVNDILTVGADPLFFLDYFACGRLELGQAEAVISGIVEGCRQAGCTLLGGETAEMPGMYPDGEYDLAGFAVGVVERARLVDGSRARAGDAVLGLPSSGLHSNGYSLARRVLVGEDPRALERELPELGRTLAEELLEPTRIYARAVRALLGADGVQLNALAHITGGGLVDNPPRCVPDGLAFKLRTGSWEVPPVMRLIAERGPVAVDEMRRTFNMGLGMIVIVPADQADRALRILGELARVVGEIVGQPGVEFV